MISHLRAGANAKIRELNIEQDQVVCLDSKIFLQNDSQKKRVTRGDGNVHKLAGPVIIEGLKFFGSKAT